MKKIRGVSIAVESNNKFLVLRRSRYESLPGLLEFPAGEIYTGELPGETAVRELIEETGLRPNGILYKGRNRRISSYRKSYLTFYYFYVDDFSGEVKLSREHDDYWWLRRREILKMIPGKEINKDSIALIMVCPPRQLFG